MIKIVIHAQINQLLACPVCLDQIEYTTHFHSLVIARMDFMMQVMEHAKYATLVASDVQDHYHLIALYAQILYLLIVFLM